MRMTKSKYFALDMEDSEHMRIVDLETGQPVGQPYRFEFGQERAYAELSRLTRERAELEESKKEHETRDMGSGKYAIAGT